MHSWSTFGARTSHRQTQIHKIHHSPDLKETTTFPLVTFSVLGHEACTQMSFCPGTQVGSLEIPEIPEIGIPTTLDAYNFLCKPPIEVKSKTKL